MAAKTHTHTYSLAHKALNVIGFACYTTYVCAMYFSPTIQDLYHDKYGLDAQISVQSNDVAFAVHALVLTIATLGQIAYYDRQRQSIHRPSALILHIIGVLLSIIILTPILVLLGDKGLMPWKLSWLDYLYVLSFVKVGVTLIKYIPQVVLNYKRKSTLGWSEYCAAASRGVRLSTLRRILSHIERHMADYSGLFGRHPQRCSAGWRLLHLGRLVRYHRQPGQVLTWLCLDCVRHDFYATTLRLVCR